MWKVPKNRWVTDPEKREIDASIFALSSTGCTFIRIVLHAG
jgi:hypothetical protein